MKQIPLLQGKALLVELPKQDFIKAKIQTLVDLQTVWSGKLNFKKGDGWESVSFPPGKWRIIGMLSEMTESDASGLVKSLPNPWNHQKRSYRNHQVESKYAGGAYLFDSAIESLESAILAEGWYFKNPLENERNKIGLGTLDNFDQDYEQAQSRVLYRSRCLLLGRESN